MKNAGFVVFRPVRLRTDVGLSGGAYTLSLSGDAGFRVWPDATGTNAPLLECGQTVTNRVNGVSFLSGADTDLYVEAVSNGTATLTYAYAGTGDAACISCSASLKITALDVEINVSSPKLGISPNPPPFAGQSAHVFRPDRSPVIDQHAVVLYKDAVDANFNVEDFDVALTASLKPLIVSQEPLSFSWKKVSGPESGELLATTSLSATYRNPKKGGVYRFRLTVRSGDKDLAFCEANVVLPLAGAEMDSVVQADLAKADLLSASVREKYGRLERLESENYKRWFYLGNAGDYVGRSDSEITPSVWYYGQVDTVNRTSETYGLGTVCTWKGTPVRLAKISNFIVGYAARKIGTIKLFTKATS